MRKLPASENYQTLRPSPISSFSSPKRLEHVLIDIIGKLPTFNGNNYCLIIIDGGTFWMEVVPIPNMTAEKIVNAFISTWIARFGCPTVVTTDQGRQFESDLFHQFSNALGSKHIHITSYHPQINSLIEK